jgi:hypothetical protein
MTCEPAVYHLSKSKLSRQFGFALVLMTASCVFIHLMGAKYPVIGGCLLALFGAVCLVNLRGLFKNGPMLTISQSGIFDVRAGMGLIEWDDIDEIAIASVNNQRFIVLQVNDPEKYLQRMSPPMRTLARANNDLVGSPIVLTTHSLTAPLDKICDQMCQYKTERQQRTKPI